MRRKEWRESNIFLFKLSSKILEKQIPKEKNRKNKTRKQMEKRAGKIDNLPFWLFFIFLRRPFSHKCLDPQSPKEPQIKVWHCSRMNHLGSFWNLLFETIHSKIWQERMQGTVRLYPLTRFSRVTNFFRRFRSQISQRKTGVSLPSSFPDFSFSLKHCSLHKIDHTLWKNSIQQLQKWGKSL